MLSNKQTNSYGDIEVSGDIEAYLPPKSHLRRSHREVCCELGVLLGTGKLIVMESHS